MTKPKTDIYRDVHKGLRKELFDLVMLVGATDFGDREALETVQRRFVRTVDLLEMHSRHEDKHMQPLIEALDKEKAARIAEAHVSVDVDVANLLRQVNLVKATDEDVAARGRQIYLQLNHFVAAYLEHIALEEEEVNTLLLKAYDDDFLAALSAKIRSDIPPPAMETFMSCMIPAVNNPERGEILNGMKASAPPEVFEGFCQLAKGVLTDGDWQKLHDQIA